MIAFKNRMLPRSLIWLVLCAAECTAQTVSLQDADKELFAARYKKAADLYAKVLAEHPAEGAAYYGLVRALIKDHRSAEAYAKAAVALERFPKNAAVLSAAGLAAYRKGDIGKAQQYFLAAGQIDAGDVGSLCGMASINRTVSRYKTARNLLLEAYRKSPGDPRLMIEHANTLKGAEHIAALREALAIYDADSEEARGLRAHISDDIAAGDRKLRRLVSAYEKSTIKLALIQNGMREPRGVGIRVQFNQRDHALLMLDTGASGISVSSKFAEHAGLEKLGDESIEAKGIGDKAGDPEYRHLAAEIRMGDVAFADYPISAFRSARTSDFDGLIGADVFRQFIVSIDFPDKSITLEPRASGLAESDGPIDAATAVPSGFQRVFRFGNHLAIPVSMNEGKSNLFLIDSGSSSNLVDETIVRDASKVYREDHIRVRGIQGEVKKTSMADNVTLAFAGFRQSNASVIAISLESLSDGMGITFGGILGMPVLRQMALTLDYQEGIARFEYKRALR